MTSKELIEKVKHCGFIEWRLAIEKIEKDLERLEKLKKALEIMWNKNVNIVYIKIFKYFEKYSEYYTGYSSKDKLTKEEFDLLKDVLENVL